MAVSIDQSGRVGIGTGGGSGIGCATSLAPVEAFGPVGILVNNAAWIVRVFTHQILSVNGSYAMIG